MKAILSTIPILAFALMLIGRLAFAVDMKDLPNPAGSATEMKEKATSQLLDINSASEEQLKKLPGIGDTYAKKIISGRPFSDIEQLKSKNIVPPDIFEKIKGFIVAR